MNAVLVAASSLLSFRAYLVHGRPTWLLAAECMNSQDTPLLFLLILVLDFSIAGLMVLASGLSQFRSRSRLRKELREAKCTLALQLKRCLALLDNGNDGILLLTAEGQILYASTSAQEICGPADGSLIGRSALSFVHDGDRRRMVHALDVLAGKRGAIFTLELRCRRADGSWH